MRWMYVFNLCTYISCVCVRARAFVGVGVYSGLRRAALHAASQHPAPATLRLTKDAIISESAPSQKKACCDVRDGQHGLRVLVAVGGQSASVLHWSPLVV